MREIVIGVVIRGKDEATPATKSSGEAVKNFGAETEKAEKKTKGSGEETKRQTSFLHSLDATLRIAEKAWRAFNATVGAAVRASLESRSIFDANNRSIIAFEKSTSKLERSMGDVLVPILAGMASAFKPLVDGMSHWIDQNRKLIASEILPWITKLGTVLVDVVATAILIVAHAWAGWYEIIDAIKVLADSFFELLLGRLHAFMEEATPIVSVLMPSMAAAFADAKRDVEIWGIAFGRAADVASHSILDTEAKLALLDTGVIKARNAIVAAIAVGATNAFKNMNKEIARGSALDDFAIANAKKKALLAVENQRASETAAEYAERIRTTLLGTAEALTTNATEAKAMAAELFKAHGAMKAEQITQAANAFSRGWEQSAAMLERANHDIETLDQKIRDLAQAGAGAFTGELFPAIAAIADGTKSATQAFGEMSLSLLKMAAEHVASLGIEWAFEQAIALGKKALHIGVAVSEAAANAGAKAAATTAAVAAAAVEVEAAKATAFANAVAAHMSIPFAGLAIGSGMGAAAVALITAEAVLPGIAAGGLITGGIAGRDSVPAMLMPGEYVLPTHVVQAIRSGTPPGSSRGGPSLAPGGSGQRGGSAPAIVLQSNFPQSRAEIDRFLRDSVAPGIARLRRHG